MLDAVKSIIVICSWYDGVTDTDQEASFMLDGVSIYFDHSAVTSSNGIAGSDTAKIRIPYREDYVPAEQWKKTHRASEWTLQIGGKVVIDGQSKTILRWRDNTCRRFEPHWYVEVC